ncbi:MAG: type IV pilus assembly protein PilM [Patescibacteria group bacterium]
MFQSQSPTAWGLDIGEKSLKMSAVIQSGDNFALSNYGSLTIEDEEVTKGILQDPDLLGKKIKKLLKEHTYGRKVKTPFVHACIPDSDTFVKLIDIPDMTDEEIPEAVRWASEQHIPLSPDDIYIDWNIVRHDPQNKKIYVLIGAVQKSISNQLTEAIKRADLVPLSLDVEATAIVRALQSLTVPTNTSHATAFLDLGATHSTIIIFARDTIQFVSTIPFSGEEITSTLATELSISKAEAEKAKIVCGLTNPDCEDALKQVLKKDLDAMTKKINSSFAFYKEHTFDPLPINQLILCGGGSLLDGIVGHLGKEIECDVRLGNLAPFISSSSKSDFAKKNLSYTTALGLAMKAYE